MRDTRPKHRGVGSMKRTVLTVVAVVAGLAYGSGSASADLGDYLSNPGFQQSQTVSCNSGHGAFEFYRGTPGVIGDAARTGGSNGLPGIGDTTGPTNSGFAQFCKTQ